MREAATKAGIKLLEPIIKLVVLTPACWRKAIITDMAERRAVLELQSVGRLCVLVAHAPLAQLFGYKNALAFASQGEARSAMLYDRYEMVPTSMVPPNEPLPAAAALRA